VTSAAVSPFYKECQQRGYQIQGEKCSLPDGSQCLIEEFNAGTCGQKFKTEDYCIKRDGRVWDKNKCCHGLKPYLPEGVLGQPTCQPIKTDNIVKTNQTDLTTFQKITNDTPYNKNSLFSIIILFVSLALISWLLYFLIKNKSK
jgi:hypothetical protein